MNPGGENRPGDDDTRRYEEEPQNDLQGEPEAGLTAGPDAGPEAEPKTSPEAEPITPPKRETAGGDTGSRVAAQASGGLAGVRPPDPDNVAGKRTYAPDFLTELFRNPLDPGYADAAERKAREGGPTGARKWTRSSIAVVTLIGLGLLLVVAYKQTVAEAPARTKDRETLIGQVQSRRAETDKLQTRADQLNSDVSALQKKQLGSAALTQLRDLESVTGLAAVTGNGAKVTLVDGPTPVNALTGEKNTAAQVKDTDLQLAVNALWSLGAEAVAINGQRLTATSTIRQAGEAILVDFRPVSTPYEVEAIGPSDLAKNFRDGYAGIFFKELAGKYGMSFTAADAKNIRLDAATELKLRVAEPSTSPSPSPGPDSSGKPSSKASEGGR